MKVFALPTLVAGSVAGLSIIFYLALSNLLGDDRLGTLLLAQAIGGLIGVVSVPQCWVFLMASRDEGEVRERFSIGVRVEARGFLTGLGLSIALMLLPLEILAPVQDLFLLMFLSFFVQLCSSSFGLFRVRQAWKGYAAWSLMPNIIRAILVAGFIFVPPRIARLSDLGLFELSLIFFLAPEVLRFALLHIPNILRNFKAVEPAVMKRGTKQIFHNWLFDVGSGATDVCDRIVVGLLLGLNTLVAYFFARRMATLCLFVCEPFFAEMFRRISIGAALGPIRLSYRRAYLMGLAIAAGMFLGVASGATAAWFVPPLKALIPEAILEMLPLFAGIMFIDSLNAASKWGRYASQRLAVGHKLLGVRLIAAISFYGSLAVAGGAGWEYIVLGFAFACSIEAAYVYYLGFRSDIAPQSTAGSTLLLE